MEKKSFVIIAVAVILVGVGLGVHLLTSKNRETKEAQTTVGKATVVNVDDVVREPEKFTGIIGVEGSVTDVDERKSTFALGCEDACILMPVKYDGRLPREGTNVIAYGEIKKTEEAKYIFVAREIAAK